MEISPQYIHTIKYFIKFILDLFLLPLVLPILEDWWAASWFLFTLETFFPLSPVLSSLFHGPHVVLSSTVIFRDVTVFIACAGSPLPHGLPWLQSPARGPVWFTFAGLVAGLVALSSPRGVALHPLCWRVTSQPVDHRESLRLVFNYSSLPELFLK